MKKQKILALLLVTLCLFYFYLCWEDDDDYPVDVVYLWVDENDPERETYKKLEGIIKNDGNSSENRFNNNEELRYSLRSLEMYCPWVNNIYVFVKDGQCPDFLNLNNPKIHLVFHSEVIPKEYLPLFNSNPIEQHVYKIPGLADRYIYFNDDLMVNKPMKKADFFLNGIPVVNWRETKLKNYDNTPSLPYDHPLLLWYNYRIAQKLFNVNYMTAQLHTPSPCYKPWEEELDKIIKQNGLWNIRKFRTNRDVVINNCLRTLFYRYKGSPKTDWGEGYVAFRAEDKCKLPNEHRENKFLCVNEISSSCKNEYVFLMEKLYPNKSQYEL